MKKLALLLLITAGLITASPAQNNTAKWRWRYFSVKEVKPENGKQTVHIQLDRYENYRLLQELKKKSDYKEPKYGETKTHALAVNAKDSTLVIRPLHPGDKHFVDFSLPVLSKSFIDDNKTYKPQLVYQLPAGSTVMKGDLVPLEVEKKVYNDSLLFFRLEDMQINLLQITEENLFPNGMYAWNSAKEMEAVKMITEEIQYAGAFYMDKMKDPFITSGPLAGKTAPQVLAAATEKQVIRFIKYIATHPREFIGNSFKVAEVYGTWVKAGEPNGDYKNLLVEQDYNKWIGMKLIEIDLDAGTIDKKPIQQVLNNWKNLYPWYDGDEKDDNDEQDQSEEEEEEYETKKETQKKPAANPYLDYTLLGNGLTYFPKQKALKIFLVNHQYVQYSKLKEGTVKELKQKLGNPARVMKNGNYLYATAYGSIEFMISGFYETVSCIYIYPVKPAAVQEAEPE